MQAAARRRIFDEVGRERRAEVDRLEAARRLRCRRCTSRDAVDRRQLERHSGVRRPYAERAEIPSPLELRATTAEPGRALWNVEITRPDIAPRVRGGRVVRTGRRREDGRGSESGRRRAERGDSRWRETPSLRDGSPVGMGRCRQAKGALYRRRSNSVMRRSAAARPPAAAAYAWSNIGGVQRRRAIDESGLTRHRAPSVTCAARTRAVPIDDHRPRAELRGTRSASHRTSSAVVERPRGPRENASATSLPDVRLDAKTAPSSSCAGRCERHRSAAGKQQSLAHRRREPSQHADGHFPLSETQFQTSDLDEDGRQIRR